MDRLARTYRAHIAPEKEYTSPSQKLSPSPQLKKARIRGPFPFEA